MRRGQERSFIEVKRLGGKTEVRFRVELAFDLETGAAEAGRYGAIHHEGEGYRPCVWVNGRSPERKTAAEAIVENSPTPIYRDPVPGERHSWGRWPSFVTPATLSPAGV
ncbi:MAG TPA: hypothetical protein VLQ45_27855 [Thermoanaerobaculia bacterium]|nr:hypothetical protein [Thermoanaerobaculia bacterium]